MILEQGDEISGLNPVARSESLAAIFSRTDLSQKKNGQMPIAKLKYLVANGDLATGNFAPCIRGSWFMQNNGTNFAVIIQKTNRESSAL
jgi:hypothetical protein